MLSNEDLDEKNQPSNPKLSETVHQFLMRQRELADQQKYPPETEFDCIRCGDCCRYNFYHLNVNDRRLLDQLYMLNENPHGYWVLMDDGKLAGYMPIWVKSAKAPMLSFDGPLPKEHIDFLMRTGRRHGYWVLAKEIDEIVIYNPAPCHHFVDNKLGPTSCAIYFNRPEICKMYSCRRYPIR